MKGSPTKRKIKVKNFAEKYEETLTSEKILITRVSGKLYFLKST